MRMSGGHSLAAGLDGGNTLLCTNGAKATSPFLLYPHHAAFSKRGGASVCSAFSLRIFFLVIKYFKIHEIFPRESVLYRCNGKDVICLKDHEIVSLFFERSEQAITELVCKYGAAMKKVASNILNDPQDVEECLSDTYLHIWNRIPPTKPQHLGAYVCRIARNVCLTRYHADTAQKRNSHYDVALEELEGTIPALSTVETEYDAKELTGYLNRFLARLSQEDRYLFLRRYWYGDGISEIAKHLQITPHTASVRLFRLRQRLQKHLEKEGLIA